MPASEVSGGRFALGLGAGSPQLADGLHDVPFRAPVRRLSAVARQVRGLLDGERIVTSTGSRGLRLAAPPKVRVPLHMAGIGPAAIGLCGELADACYPFLLPVSGLKEATCLLEEGAARAGWPRPRISPGIPTAVLPDPDAAREVGRSCSWAALAAARARGVLLGRPAAMTPEQVRHARDLLARPDNTASSIARLLNVSRSTIYKYVPELGHRTVDAAPALDVVLAALPEDPRPPPDVTKYDDLLPSHRPPSGGR